MNLKSKNIIIGIPASNGIVRLRNSHEIKFINGSGPVSTIHIQCGLAIKSIRGLSHYNRWLDEGQDYFRFSQSLLVNLQYVDRFDPKRQEVTLRCGAILSISRRGAQQFKKLVRQFDETETPVNHTISQTNEPNKMNNNN